MQEREGFIMTNIKMLGEQGISPFVKDSIVNDLSKKYAPYMGIYFEMITSFYYAGLINGKRIERARRKKNRKER